MKRIAWISAGLGVIVVGLMGLSGCANVPITGRNRTVIMNESQLASLSAAQYSSLVASSNRSTSVTANAMLDRVSKRLVTATTVLAKQYGFEQDLALFQWEFTLIDDPKTVNAFCMPGGKVVVYTGILPIAKDDAGLAVILGHEIAHALAKHGNERMSQQALVNMGGSILDQTLEKSPEETRQLFGAVYGVGTTLGVLLPYSRLHESEADKIGLILLKHAGYDPLSAVGFWERMSAQSNGKNPPEFLSTHPSDQTRINDIKKLIADGL